MSGLRSAGFGLSTRAGGGDDEGSTGWGAYSGNARSGTVTLSATCGHSPRRRIDNRAER